VASKAAHARFLEEAATEAESAAAAPRRFEQDEINVARARSNLDLASAQMTAKAAAEQGVNDAELRRRRGAVGQLNFD
jgi:hypothetical protein